MIATFLSALVLSLLLTAVVRRLARNGSLVDQPDRERHLHDLPIPRGGGLAVYASVVAVFITVLLIRRYDGVGPIEPFQKMLVLMAAGGVVFFLGLWDDLSRLPARTKFVLEVLIAVGVFAAGIQIDRMTLAGGGILTFPVWISLPLTVVWIVGITNAFNLIDGSDGVAAGATLFASITIAIVCLDAGAPLAGALALAMAGATLGFLLFNFPPASIFLGDSGSLFLGFTLATLGIVIAQETEGAMALAMPAVACGLPILDTSLAVARRFLRREPIFSPDRGHIHHRLSDLGLSRRNVVLLLYALCAAFALLSLLLLHPAETGALTGLMLVLAVAAVTVGRLEIPELIEVRRALGRGLKQRTVISHNVRIREAIARLHAATSAESVLGALAHAFDRGEFDRVELWLEARVGAPLASCEGIERLGGGVMWSLRRSANGTPPDGWAAQLPFRDDNGELSRTVGHLAFWHDGNPQHLLTDLRLVARQFQPELLNALARLRRGPTRPQLEVAPPVAKAPPGPWVVRHAPGRPAIVTRLQADGAG